MGTLRIIGALACAFIAGFCGSADVARAQDAGERVAAAIENISNLVRAGRIGYATFWDGNKYIQCRRTPERELRCEAAGFSMQPSLRHVLKPERLERLAALGWNLDPSFGNYVKAFPASMPASQTANHILQTLTEVYSADVAELETQTAWVRDMPCPPRNGPTQNLAGMVNEPTSVRMIVILDCAFKLDPTMLASQTLQSAEGLIGHYGALVTAEIQRLRINHKRSVFAVFDSGIGYIQCRPEPTPPAIRCEAQSAESWSALASVLTPERVSRLRSAGYADPGRGPNYSKSYLLASLGDATIAQEILTILHGVYGYTGAAKLAVKTELPSN